MKKTIKNLIKGLILLFVFLSDVFAQSSAFFDLPEKKNIDNTKAIVTYLLEYHSDSTNLDDKRAEEVILFIGNSHSLFISYNRARNDSLLEETARKMKNNPSDIQNLFSYYTTSSNPSRFNFEIFKNHEENLLTFIDRIWTDHYSYTNQMNNLNWQIAPDSTKKVLGYSVQKAFTRYGGRKWEAWFSPDIPINDGPYIFHGLPGLIIQIYDTKNHYRFNLVGIEVPENERPIQLNLYDNLIHTTHKNLNRAQENFRQSFIIHAQDAQLVPESQRIAAENMRRRNNPIELRVE